MSEPNPAGQHATKPTFGDRADRTGNSRLWLPVLVVMLAFLIGAAILTLSGALTGGGGQAEAPGQQDQAAPADVGAPGAR